MVVFQGRKPFFGRVLLSSSGTHLLLLHIDGSLTSAGESSSGSQGAEEFTSPKKLNLYSFCQAAGWSRECAGRGRAAPFLPGSLSFSGSEDPPTRAPAFLQPITAGQTLTSSNPLSRRPTLRTSSASSTPPRPLAPARPWRQGLTLALGGCVEGRQQLGGR